MFNTNGQGLYHKFDGNTEIDPVTAWDEFVIDTNKPGRLGLAQIRADGINTSANTPGNWTVRNGLAAAGSDTVLRYYDYDGVDDYIGPVQAGFMTYDGYDNVTGIDSTGIVFAIGMTIGLWIRSTAVTDGIPVLCLGHPAYYGVGIWWDCGSTSGSISASWGAATDRAQTESLPDLSKDKWVFILIDSYNSVITINSKRVTWRGAGSSSYNFLNSGPVFDGTGGFGEVRLKDANGQTLMKGSQDRYGSNAHYVEVGRALGYDALSTSEETAHDDQTWSTSLYTYAPDTFLVGETLLYGEAGFHDSATTGNYTCSGTSWVRTPTAYLYCYNKTLSAGQKGYYHAQTL